MAKKKNALENHAHYPILYYESYLKSFKNKHDLSQFSNTLRFYYQCVNIVKTNAFLKVEFNSLTKTSPSIDGN